MISRNLFSISKYQFKMELKNLLTHKFMYNQLFNIVLGSTYRNSKYSFE